MTVFEILCCSFVFHRTIFSNLKKEVMLPQDFHDVTYTILHIQSNSEQNFFLWINFMTKSKSLAQNFVFHAFLETN